MLLSVPLKTTRRYDIGPPLAKWVDSTHPHYTSSQCRDDLIRLSSLRNCISESICTPHGHVSALRDRALEDCVEYHACLLEAERRGFPTSDDSVTGAHELRLSWDCAFGEERPAVRSNLRYERSCSLFDVAALLSYRASGEDHRASRDGRGRAMRLYGRAASALRHVRTELMSGADGGGGGGGGGGDDNPSADLTEPCLLMLECAMMAQGQLCAYEAGLSRDGPVPALLAKLAMGASDLYGEALTHSQDLILRARVPNASSAWGAHLKAMSMLFRARAERHEGEACRSRGEHGSEVARLRNAEFMCGEAAKFRGDSEASSSSGSALGTREGGMGMLGHEIDWLVRTVRQRRETAERDNRSIYMDGVPDVRDLEPIRGQSMMTKLPPLDEELDPKSLKRPIFAKLPKV